MLHIIHNLGGCGGTVLSRCMGVLPGVALLSEINPASVKLFSQFNPIYQDENWLYLLSPADRDNFSRKDLGDVEVFRELIGVFHIRACESGRHLILRDYNFVDFVGVPYTTTPPRRLTLYAALPEGVPTRSAAFIRHPVDQWSSLCKHDHVRSVLSPTAFCEAYVVFLEELGGIPTFKYEDFAVCPAAVLREMCDALLLPFEGSFSERFHTFDNVTGDFSRHQERAISLPGPKNIPAVVVEEFRQSTAYTQVLRATGYADRGVEG
jgi:hypothetical protein